MIFYNKTMKTKKILRNNNNKKIKEFKVNMSKLQKINNNIKIKL